jgi:hypothetical protein
MDNRFPALEKLSVLCGTAKDKHAMPHLRHFQEHDFPAGKTWQERMRDWDYPDNE